MKTMAGRPWPSACFRRPRLSFTRFPLVSASTSEWSHVASPDHRAKTATSDPVEGDLVQASLAGDAGAARELVRRYQNRIYTFVRHMTRQAQDAEDITQETFIKAFRNLDRFDHRRPLANWLFTIARRTALNHFRGAREWVALPEDAALPAATPAGAMEEQDEVNDIWARARQQLPPREFEVLWLRYAENLSIRETAEVTCLTTPHVKILVFRARRRLLRNPPSP